VTREGDAVTDTWRERMDRQREEQEPDEEEV